MEELILPVVNELKDQLLGELIPVIQEQVEKAITSVKKNAIPFIKDFLKGFQSSGDYNTVYESLETLNKNRLIEIAKQHIVAGSTEVAAYKTETADSFVIYLAYTKDKELLDSKDNCYVIIKCEALAKDVTNLFGEDKLIILQ